MFTEVTWQDFHNAEDKCGMLPEIVEKWKASAEFRQALEAQRYFRGDNSQVSRKTVLRARKIETRDESGRKRIRSGTADVVGNRIGSNFLFRFVAQQNQYLLSDGVLLGDAALKAQLGTGFDHALEELGEKALLQGVSWGWWNAGHLEVIASAADALSGFAPLVDEMTGEVMAGVQFWQLSTKRPLYVRFFEADGVTVYRKAQDGLQVLQPKRAYKLTYRQDALGETLLEATNWGRLPILPLLANSDGRSEFTPAIKAKIDAYDNILSDFADNLDRANDVYWVLNNFGGTTDDIAEMLEEIQRIKAVANLSDGTGSSSTAEPKTIEVPYAARQTALRLLEKALYEDYMALDFTALTESHLTNVAIRVACANLDLKADRYEWQVFRFVRSLLSLLGTDTDEIRFPRQVIGNAGETVQDIYTMRQDIDRRTALRLNPYIQPDELDRLLQTEAQQP